LPVPFLNSAGSALSVPALPFATIPLTLFAFIPTSAFSLDTDDSVRFLTILAEYWPDFARLRSAVSRPKRFTFDIGRLLSNTRIIFSCSLLLARQHPALHSSSSNHILQFASFLHSAISKLLVFGSACLHQSWHWSTLSCDTLFASLCAVISALPFRLENDRHSLKYFNFTSIFDWTLAPQQLPDSLCIFFMALSNGLPWLTVLSWFSSLSPGWFTPNNLCFASAAFQTVTSQTNLQRVILVHSDIAGPITILLLDDFIVSIAAPYPLRIQHDHWIDTRPLVHSISRPGKVFYSRFWPDYVCMPTDESGRIIYEKHHITSMVLHRQAWLTRLVSVDAITLTILEGKLVMPKTIFPAKPSWKRNHSSWNLKAKIALGPSLASWINQGIVEVGIPGLCRMPLYIEPLGAVDKATAPYQRIITDSRLSNEIHQDWGVWYNSAEHLSALIDFGDILFADDMHDAYHSTPFAGCTGELHYAWVLTIGPSGSVIWSWRPTLGCTFFTCNGVCDKSCNGFSTDGFICRFAATHFGQKNAGAPLNTYMRCILRYLALLGRSSASSSHSNIQDSIMTALWVDDTIMVSKSVPHGRCPGLIGNCRRCHEHLKRAKASQVFWHKLADDLGLSLNSNKRQDPSQRVTFTGLIIDTIQMIFQIPIVKHLRLLASLIFIRSRTECSLRQLCSVRGRVRHYCVCIRHMLPLVPIFSAVLGSEGKVDYDGIVQLPYIIAVTADHLISVVNTYALAGQPLHPYVPSSLYHSLITNQVGSAHIVAITYDASLHGWGALIRWWNNLDGIVIVGHLPSNDDMLHQVRREAEAAVLAFTASAKIVDLHLATCILRNDARGALSSLRKGNFRSTYLQYCATRLSKAASALNCDLLFLHAPGRDLEDEGIDRLSRTVALSLRGPSCNIALRHMIIDMASLFGWVLSVDLFATYSNALTTRFFSRFSEPLSEFEDAFGVDNWNQSLCPHCHQLHRETVFAFPPLPLINRFLHKAMIDKVRGIVVVPLAVTSQYWNRLLQVSIGNAPDGYYRLRHAHSHLDWAADYTAPELAIFCIDFGYDSDFSFLVPRCPYQEKFRGRPVIGSLRDQLDRERIHNVLRDRLHIPNTDATSS
jgi:hypothetical protein